MRNRNGFQRSTFTNAIAAHQPYYSPPTIPQTSVERGGAQVFADMRPYEMWDQHSVPVNRAPLLLGMRFMFGRVARRINQFRMVATGRVASTQFQPIQKHEFGITGWNDAICIVGYPRNLGLSFKVPTIPKTALGTSPNQMLPRPQIKRSVYVNRRPFNSGVPAVPATPTMGRHS